MVARLDENFSKPGQRRSQRRLSWKSEAIKKGQLRISVPVSEMDENDGPLPEGHAYPLPPLTADAVMRRPRVFDEPLPERSNTAVSAPKDNIQHALKRHASTSNAHSQSARGSQRHTLSDVPTPQFDHKISDFEPSSSGVNTSRVYSPANANMQQMKRRRSVIRRVVRKLLGKRDDEDDPMPSRGPSVRAQEPGTPGHKKLIKDRPATAGATTESRPGPDLSPVKELEVKNAPKIPELPFPMNINAPAQPSPNQNYIGVPYQPSTSHRRNSLPSLVLSDSDVSMLASLWAGMSEKRMTGLDEYRYSRLVAESEIGVAITTPRASMRPPSVKSQTVRTARSTSALYETAKQQAAEEAPTATATRRRRSSEIRHWRESMTTRPSIYSQYQIGDNNEDVPPLNVAKIEAEKEAKTEKGTIVNATLIDQGTEQEEAGKKNKKILDDERSIASDHSRKPRAFHRPSKSIEDRMAKLEHETSTLHSYINQIAVRTSIYSAPSLDLPTSKPGSRSASKQRKPEGEKESSKKDQKKSELDPDAAVTSPNDPATFLASPSTVAPTSPQQALLSSEIPPFPNRSASVAQEGSLKPKKSTSRGPSPLPAKEIDEQRRGSEGSQNGVKNPQTPLTALTAQLTAVVAALQHERKSRKALEHKVTALQSELAELTILTQKLARGNSQHMYPTPSPDQAAHPRGRPRKNRNVPDNSGHSHDETDDSDGFPPEWDWRNSARRQTVTSHFSQDDEESGDERKAKNGGPKASVSSNVSPGDTKGIIASDLDAALLATSSAAAAAAATANVVGGRSNSDATLHRSFRRSSANRLVIDTDVANARYTRNRSVEGWQSKREQKLQQNHIDNNYSLAADGTIYARRSRRASLPPQHRYSVYSTLSAEGEHQMMQAVEKGRFQQPRVAPLVPPVEPHSPQPHHVLNGVIIGGGHFF